MINIEAEQLVIKALRRIKVWVEELGNKEDFTNKLGAKQVMIKRVCQHGHCRE